jgi:hypothetical protein
MVPLIERARTEGDIASKTPIVKPKIIFGQNNIVCFYSFTVVSG